MSRIGNLPINIPSGVSVTLKGNNVNVKGLKGELSLNMDPVITAKIEDNVLTVARSTEEKKQKSLHGLYRALINNMVIGVSQAYHKELELVGVGFRCSNKGQVLELSLGYSHMIYLQLPQEVKIETKSERNKNPLILLDCCDKELIGLVCAKIRSLRKIEPYKGKGIRFVGEQVRRKSGKSATAK